MLKNDAEWSWNAEHEEAFSKLKSMLSSESCMSYFDDSKQTFLFTDASPYGISAILMQKSAGQNDAKIITYSSRALTTAEQNYAQIERECLSIVYGCERNRLYLIGRQFNVFNDHKALINILNNPKATVPLRIERLTLRLQGFDFKLDHIKSAGNISDYPSRHPYDQPDERSSSETESYINFITTNACPQAITIEDIKTATKTDKICQHLTELIKNESWYTLDKPSNYPNLTSDELNELNQFRKFKSELTLTENDDVILKQNRIVLPLCYQKIAVKLAHVGHQGLQKTKALLRTKIYFVRLDELVEKELSTCVPCQAVTKHNTQAPIQNMPIPDRVWQTVNIDYLGPLPNGYYIFVIIDQRSRYPDVEFVHSTAATMLIPRLNRIFSTYGNPENIVSDNGSLYFLQVHSKNTYKRKVRNTDELLQDGHKPTLKPNGSCNH